MKRFFLITVLAIVAMATFTISAAKKEAEITFEETTYDFGYIQEDGGLVSHEFKFTNDGEESLVISNVHTPCGCTIPKYSTKPIRKGKSSEITINYNPKRRPGPFKKSVVVVSNAKNSRTTLTIIGSVIPKTADEE